MAVQLTCPACNAALKIANPVPPGKAVRCPKCQKVFRPPAEDEPEAADEPAPKKVPAKPAATRPQSPAASKAPQPVSRQKQAPVRQPEPLDEADECDDLGLGDEPQPQRAGSGAKKKGKDPALMWGLVAGGIGLVLALLLFFVAKSG